MSTAWLVALAVLPWVALPAIVLWQLRDATMLDEYSAEPPREAPLVSVIVPARDEARNIEACVRSILATTWPKLEVIVVDDHSTDGTGEIARRVAAGDPRVRVIANPDLPEDWFGKQWACHNGAQAARGELLLFTDADTRHGPELLARSVNAMRARGADLFSVFGGQTMETLWERLIQPHMFTLILARFGATERVSRSTDPKSKLVNGQFMLLSRVAYERTGGHAAVRTHVAEDLRMAQEWTRLKYSVQVVVGREHMTTRMYNGLGEIARGWGKNIYAAGRDTLSLGPVGRAVLRVIFPLPALWEIVPPVVAVAAAFGAVAPGVGAWGAIAYAVTTLYWGVVNAWLRVPLRYAPLHPLAALVIFGIFTRAAWKGERVEWKGREYVSR